VTDTRTTTRLTTVATISQLTARVVYEKISTEGKWCEASDCVGRDQAAWIAGSSFCPISTMEDLTSMLRWFQDFYNRMDARADRRNVKIEVQLSTGFVRVDNIGAASGDAIPPDTLRHFDALQVCDVSSNIGERVANEIADAVEALVAELGEEQTMEASCALGHLRTMLGAIQQ
jgi:hypothetical protein